jgi:hypothetical protein
VSGSQEISEPTNLASRCGPELWITSFTLAAGASDGGADGFTVFVGFTTATPEPSTLGKSCIGATGFCLYAWRRQKRTARAS